MICVNLKDPNFQYLAQHHGVSISKLELITHKYRQMTGIKDAFPSDVFIANELGRTPYKESVKKVIELYNMNPGKYDPKEFATSEEAYAEAERLQGKGFAAESMVVYPNSKNGYTLSLRRPVADNKLQVKDIIGRYTLDPQEIADFVMVQAAMGVEPVALTDAEKIMTPEVIQHLINMQPALGKKVHLLPGMTKFFKDNPNALSSIQQAIREEQEMQTIKEQAIKDGTFMKAPNGKPTNLTERQWLQVRTKAFKDWFGDWETFNTKNPYSSDISLGDITMDFDSADANGAGAILVIKKGNKVIGSIALNAYYRSKDKFEPWGKDKDKYVSMSSVGDAVEIDAENRGKGYGKAAYFEMAKLAAKNSLILTSAPDNSRTVAATRVWKSLERDGYVKKVGDRYEFINSSLTNASKVVDENGEPLVVYHGSPNHGFTTFSATAMDRFDRTTQNIDKYIYFSKDKRTAMQFALTDEEFQELNKAGDSETYEESGVEISSEKLEARVYPVFLNIKDAKQIEANKKAVYQLDKDSLDDIKNHDGAIITNVAEQLSPELLELMPEADEYLKHPFTTDYLVSNPNQIKSATDNNGMFSTEDNDIQMSVYNPYSENHPYHNKIKASKKKRAEILEIIKNKKYTKSGSDIVTLESDKHKFIYIIDHSSQAVLEENQRENEELGIETDLFGIRGKFQINKLKENGIREIARNIAPDYNYSETRISQVLQNLGVRPEELPGIDITAGIQGGIRDSVEMDAETGEFRKQAYSNGSGTNSREDQELLSGTSRRNQKLTQAFITPDNDVIYGFVDKEGNIYLDETIISPEHPIHEYTHLWDRVLADKNPDLWKRGIDLMKDPHLKLKGHDKSLWEEIEEDPNYGQMWQSIKKDNPAKYESLIASEVHAKITGKEGLRRLNEIAEEKGAKGIINKLKEWMLEAWKELKATFSAWSDEEIQKLTLDDFVNMTIRDFADGIDLQAINQDNSRSTNKEITNETEKAINAAGEKAVLLQRLLEQIPRTDTSGSGRTSDEGQSLRNGVQQTAREQETALTLWAIQNGAEVSNPEASFKDQYGKMLRGKESRVWRNPTSNKAIKALYPRYYNNFNKLLDRIIVHNMAFPETAMKITNIGTDGSNADMMGSSISIIVEQPWVDDSGEIPTFEEIEHYMTENLGFTKTRGTGATAEYVRNNYMVTDIRPENVIKQPNGELAVIDCYATFRDIPTIQFSIESQERTEAVTQELDDYDRVNQQIDRLNENNILTSTEVRHVAELAFNALSDMVTEIQQNEGRAQELFPSKDFKDFDFQSATRKEIINKIGIGTLLEGVKERYFNSENSEEEDIATLREMDEIYDNWEGILTFGTDIFSANEGFGLKRNRRDSRWEMSTGMHLGYESLNAWEDPDSIREQVGDEQEHWQIERRTIDALTSATELVRQALQGFYIMKNGKEVTKYGIKERVQPRKAMQSLLAWTVGSQSLKEMIARLSEKESFHPWISQLKERLSKDDGSESDFQSQFFTTLCKSYQSYSIVLNEDGKYAAIPVNDHPASSDIMENISGMFQAKVHPLFQGENKTISKELLGNKGDSEFSLHKALDGLQQMKDAHNLDLENEPLSPTEQQRAIEIIYGVSKILGFDVADETLSEVVTDKNNIIGFGKYEDEDNRKSMLQALSHIVENLDKAYEKQKNGTLESYQPFTYKAENGIRGDIANFIKPIADVMDETVTNVVYDDGKLYQGYVTPSYLTLLFEKFHWDQDKFEDFIEENYGKSQWFKLKDEWRTPWLDKLTSPNGERFEFKHRVELNFNKHAYMRRMSPEEYTISKFTHFFSEYNWNDNKKNPLVWFAAPIMSNKPSSEFIRFYAEMGDTYKNDISNGLYKVFLQELSRIQTVGMRHLSKDNPDFIKNWDKLGNKFAFLPVFNGYLEGSKGRGDYLNDSKKDAEFAKWLQTLVNRGELSADNQVTFITYATEIIKNSIERKVQRILDSWERTGIIEEAKNVKNIMPDELSKRTGDEGKAAQTAFVKDQLEKFIWNDHYASINILQLTVGDIASYKDAEDLQKRLAELHAPGNRPHKEATDYEGKKISDGVYRTLILKDWDGFISNVISNISEICDRRITAAPESQKAGLKAWKEHLVGKKGVYRQINVADAQAFSSPSSYRKKAFMFGRWSHKAEDIYKKLLDGEFNETDLETAFQPLKPFVYAQIMKDVGIRGEVNSPIQTMPIPFQAKNAEYLLIMADAIIRGAEKNGIQTGKPNFLRAIYTAMEDSAYDGRKRDVYGNITKKGTYNGKGIDTVQFESAIKSGLQGALNLHQFIDSPNGEELAYNEIVSQIYQDGQNEDGTYYNYRSFVQSADYSTYCLQQEVPDHFRNHSQAQGSQERMIIPSDLDAYNINVLDEEGNPIANVYTWTDPDGTQRSESAGKVRQEYEETAADNIDADADDIRNQFGLLKIDRRTGEVVFQGAGKTERNLALSRILLEEIEDSASRYGVDLYQACQINKETGEFRIPLGDPIQAKRIEQLIHSVIKNRVNKQEIAGGPIVQVSNYGTSQQLHIRFNARNGGLLKMESEFKPSGKYPTYNAYKKAEQAGIAYFEVFAPAWNKELYKFFMDKDGNIDMGSLELLNPDLFRMISYRIPTEDKYSIAPMKVVGFLPKEAGSAVMFPYELTGIDGSDFDVDKRYVMRKQIEISFRVEPKKGEDAAEAEKDYIKHNRRSIIDGIKKNINLSALVTPKEKDEVIKKQKSETELRKRAAEKEHLENLSQLSRMYEQATDVLSEIEFSKNEDKNEEIWDKQSDKDEKEYDKLVAKEDKRYKKKLEQIDVDMTAKILEEFEDYGEQRLQWFLDSGRFLPSSSDGILTREIRRAYLNYMFPTLTYGKGKFANNDKIFEMTWGILTNEMTADKILNPGGFDNLKKQAYLVTAYKLGKGQWNQLQSMPMEDLKELSSEAKDFTFIDTQVQFYKQNAAAASLIGVFAVHKIAHAVLSGDGILIDVDNICNTSKPFSIAGFTYGGYRDAFGKALMTESEFKDYQEHGHHIEDGVQYADYITATADFGNTGRMELDPREDTQGALVGKTLGSGVGASADAAKEPCLDQLNVNMTTVNILNTMVRLGMPVEDATLFTSQEVISRLLDEYSRQNLSNNVQLDDILNEWLDNIREEENITDESAINYEPLDREELVQGLKPEHSSRTDYKALLAFQRIKLLADRVRKPTFATRFNSISSAVGPMILDNLITEYKINDFTSNPAQSTGFYDADSTEVDIHYIFDKHPILRAFAQTLDIASDILRDMPANSTGFRKLLSGMEESEEDGYMTVKSLDSLASNGLLEKVINDRKIFDNLLNFYTSYMLVQDGLLTPDKTSKVDGKEYTELKWYIEEFPTYFKNKVKDEYSDNALIRSIQFKGSKRTGRTFLQLPLTGMEEQEKAELRAAWTDLHKKNPKLSIQLAKYWVYRGGISFSPKTGTAILPNYVKEHWSVKGPDGTTITYSDVYRKMEGATPSIVIDQFVRNNWNDNKLVPKKVGSKNDYHYDFQQGKSGVLTVTGQKALKDLNGIVWMKTSWNNSTHLWKFLSGDDTHYTYTEVKPLGDNNEYVEMSTDMISSPMSNTTQTIADMESAEVAAEQMPVERSRVPSNPTKEAKKITRLAHMIYDYYTGVEKVNGYTLERAQMAVDGYLDGTQAQQEAYSDSVDKALKHQGINIDVKNRDKIRKEFC